jgi:hypothetical protein
MDWYRIGAKSATRDVWLETRSPDRPGETTGGAWYLPDGHSLVEPLLVEGRFDEIPYVIWFAPFNRGKRFGDMLWTGGRLKIVSVRMVRALESVEATGYRTFKVDVRDHTNSSLDGYVGFATDPAPGTDIQNLLEQTVQNMAFIAKRHVVEALRAHGADQLDIRPYDPSQYS